MKLCIALKSGLTALINPSRADAVAALGETTGLRSLKIMRDMMLRDTTGRRILRERPILTEIKDQDADTLGGATVAFLKENNIDIAHRDKVRYIEDPELAYIMFRYRQAHDLWHVMFGLNKINIESELALKAIEWSQTGLPMNILSVLFGPLNLDSKGRERFYSKVLPWAIQAGTNSKFLMNCMYEEKLGTPLELVRKELDIQAFGETF